MESHPAEPASANLPVRERRALLPIDPLMNGGRPLSQQLSARAIRTAAICLLLLSSCVPAAAAAQPRNTDEKQRAIASVERHRDELIDLSDQIWRFAETALRETRSSKLLADYAESQGFRVERGVAGMPTAFVASYGKGRPVIGILGEYDALPGLSQKASSVKEPLEEGAAGHGCGHNLFGAGSFGAALAIKELIEAGDLSGTIRFFGTPAEESIGGKIYMARDGVFDGVDACLAWHPGTELVADTDGSLAMVDFVVEFSGRAAHAAFDPWNGRSALDGLEIFTHALNLMREHVRPTVRMHYSILDGGQVPNVIPERARLWCWVRDEKKTSVDALLERVRKIAEGAALATGTDSSLQVQTGSYELLVNKTGARLLHENLDWLGPLEFTDKEQKFARRIQKAANVEAKGLVQEIKPFVEEPGSTDRGSTDVADVSWIVPTLHLTVTTAPQDAPWHAWPVVATGGMSIGHKGMIYAAKALAATMVDLYQDADRLAAIQAEFEEQTRGKTYVSYLPDGPPPVPRD
ncbi:MAG: amidohydrolase [Acidobacteriota bacterium]